MPSKSLLKQVQSLIIPSVPIPKEKLKILIVAAEVSPYANVGGFARVMGYLSRAFLKLDHQVKLFMPKFGFIDEEKYKMKKILEGLKVPTGDENNPHLACNVKMHQLPQGPEVYFLENMEYYEKRANVYGYSDDPLRWALLSRGALEFLLEQDWIPDVIHSNDWHTGIVSNYLKQEYHNVARFLPIATVFTIHNLMFQGNFDHKNIPELDFDDGRSAVAPFFSERLAKQNFMRRGIIYSDVINTVSETYAKEMLTPEYGEGLDKLLLEVRSKLFGITNGIDYAEFNPETDKLIAQNYSIDDLELRLENKLALQKEFNLPQNEDVFLIGLVARLTQQKGIDLIADVMWPFLTNFDAQFVVIGGGEAQYLEMFRSLQKDFPQQVGCHLMPNFTLPRLVFAGADIFLMPSQFEPCGLSQLESMRYGSIPIVRATGGLADTVENLDIEKQTGRGFVFKNYDKWEFFAQLVRAAETFKHKKEWQKLIKRAMKADFSWDYVAKKYIELYEKAILFRQKELIEDGRIVISNEIIE